MIFQNYLAWHLYEVGTSEVAKRALYHPYQEKAHSNNNHVLTQNDQIWERTIFFGNFVEMTIIFGNFVRAF